MSNENSGQNNNMYLFKFNISNDKTDTLIDIRTEKLADWLTDQLIDYG